MKIDTLIRKLRTLREQTNNVEVTIQDENGIIGYPVRKVRAIESKSLIELVCDSSEED